MHIIYFYTLFQKWFDTKLNKDNNLKTTYFLTTKQRRPFCKSFSINNDNYYTHEWESKNVLNTSKFLSARCASPWTHRHPSAAPLCGGDWKGAIFITWSPTPRLPVTAGGAVSWPRAVGVGEGFTAISASARTVTGPLSDAGVSRPTEVLKVSPQGILQLKTKRAVRIFWSLSSVQDILFSDNSILRKKQKKCWNWYEVKTILFLDPRKSFFLHFGEVLD